MSLPILLVEPDVLSRSSTRAILEAKGYTVLEASTAEHALTIATHRKLALVVTELYAKGAPDRVLLQSIRRSQALRRTNVLAYTRFGRVADRALAIAEGADGYVLKKNGGPRLLEVVGRLGNAARKRRRRADRPRDTSSEA